MIDYREEQPTEREDGWERVDDGRKMLKAHHALSRKWLYIALYKKVNIFDSQKVQNWKKKANVLQYVNGQTRSGSYSQWNTVQG